MEIAGACSLGIYLDLMKPSSDNFREAQQHWELDALLPRPAAEIVKINWAGTLCMV